MIRRANLRRWLALAAALSAAGLASSVAAKTLKIATVSPDGSSWMKTLRRAAGDLDAATNGRLTLRFYPGGTMGDDASVLKRMRVGQLHGGLVLTTAFANIYPDVQVYNLPMVFRNLEEVDSVRQAMDPVLMDGFRDHGFLALGLSEVGMAYPMGTRRARSVADARDLKVWAPQGDAAAVRMLRAFSITPIQMPIAEVLTGLSTGADRHRGVPAGGDPAPVVAHAAEVPARPAVDVRLRHAGGFRARAARRVLRGRGGAREHRWRRDGPRRTARTAPTMTRRARCWPTRGSPSST